MAVDYRLDDLGWFEFEQLVQSLLKSHLGMGIEAWGGHGDWGRDAYFEGGLQYPAGEETEGPFAFQCKFIESANAAGAKPNKAVLKAIRQEATRIREHLRSGNWTEAPKYYALFTNAPFTPAMRNAVRGVFASVLSGTSILTHDGNDVCQWLRDSPQIARSFPQLLSLRDLQELLRDAVHSDILARSEQAIAMAQTYARTFVPTSAYRLAQDKLASHGFVVLEGPPEMGKTTIGRIIALTQIACGWEGIECRSPADVLKMYRRDRRQVFVADDFFGRTEYEPMRVSQWQSELGYILPLLGRTHWLILTCRAHLLQMAKANLDIPNQHKRFPDLGEVVVNAGSLTPLERARIVYRHAKGVVLGCSAKETIRRHARQIVDHPHFTPERIRRLIEEVSAESGAKQERLTGGAAESQTGVARCKESLTFMTRLQKALGNPTQQMRISFRRLPTCHRWLLFSLLEVDHNTHIFEVGHRQLRARYDALCPVEVHQPYERVLAELTEGFVRKSTGSSGDRVNWIHPSCRDLSIDGLSDYARDRAHFLANCDESGLTLAISLGGGAEGLRQLPLLQTEKDWSCFAIRARQLVQEKAHVLCAIWQGYQVIKKQVEPEAGLRNAVIRLAKMIREELTDLAASKLGRSAYSDLESLQMFPHICDELQISPSIDLTEAWADCLEDVKRWAEEPDVIWEDSGIPARVATFWKILNRFFPAFLEDADIRRQLSDTLDAILERATTDDNSSYDPPKDSDEAANRASGLENQQKSFEKLGEIPLWTQRQQKALKQCAVHFNAEANSLWDEVPPEQDYDDWRDEHPSSAKVDVSIESLFCDL